MWSMISDVVRRSRSSLETIMVTIRRKDTKAKDKDTKGCSPMSRRKLIWVSLHHENHPRLLLLVLCGTGVWRILGCFSPEWATQWEVADPEVPGLRRQSNLQWSLWQLGHGPECPSWKPLEKKSVASSVKALRRPPRVSLGPGLQTSSYPPALLRELLLVHDKRRVTTFKML